MDDIDKLTRAEQEARFMEAMDKLSPNEQADMAQLMEWMVQRPKDMELTMEQIDAIYQEIRRENTRRRLGGKVGTILPFKKPGKKDQ